MKIIKVDATTSTNELSKALNLKAGKENFCVSAEFQEKGRGQQNTVWQSQKSTNLMFTVVYNDIDLDLEKRFCLNAMICLKLLNVLKALQIDKLELKWPNDILADKHKICGILIENTIVGNKIKNSYVGVGLNVNQTHFEDLPKASSLKMLEGINFDREELLRKIVKELSDLPVDFKTNSPQNIINVYKRYLYGFNSVTKFRFPNSETLSGKVEDIELDGKMLVKFESGDMIHFEHKAIQQQY